MHSKLTWVVFAIAATCVMSVTVPMPTTTTIQPMVYEIRPKILQAKYFNDDYQNVEGGAVVLKSNLPANVQTQLATSLTSIYQSISDPMQRLQQFQTVTTRMYPVYWNVVSNFDNITYYSQYYIYLQINTDRVLAFGIS
ncbi:hypothetical protein RN001_012920 [Aquatica leii]|uniref:Uncharacterized protein n=1 Tax=Aquatica leii TaxID=1421715 RepID=A0AAN7PZH2_9COLE|nr:hypothetical protein RN001_012920 [Aquatica leii]